MQISGALISRIRISVPKVACLVLGLFLTGCGNNSSDVYSPPLTTVDPASPYFKTQFQSEGQFIVEAIVSDLAEQVVYAQSQRLPDSKSFKVVATEQNGAPADALVYRVQVRLGAKDLDFKIDLHDGIWSPATYEHAAKELANGAGLRTSPTKQTEDSTFLQKLSDASAETIENENQRISGALEKDFSNPELQEQAALLLGAFLLREHSGLFLEIRSPLSRMTAHLVMARLLGGGRPPGLEGQMAEAMLLTLVNAEEPALERLGTIDTNAPGAGPIVRALRTRVTGDFRPLDEQTERTRLESIEWFSAMADYVSTSKAWSKLSQDQKQTIDFVRVISEDWYSVEIGHQLLELSLPLEMDEFQRVYKLYHNENAAPNRWIEALNALPEHAFSVEANGKVRVRIIGWGQWAAFLQRHLCYAMQQNFYFINSMWGVPDQAKIFAEQCEKQCHGLRFYPFVRRFTCTDIASYHKAVDEGLDLTISAPQWVPADCWNYLCYKPYFAPLYTPKPNPHVNEWHNHNPLPGTAYDLNARVRHPSLVGGPDSVRRFEQLHLLAPYDCRICRELIKLKYNDKPTYDQARALYSAVLPYCVSAMQAVAATLQQQPEQYKKLMLQAAQLEPSCYYDLGNYLAWRTNADEAEQYYDKACDSDQDRVRASNYALWRVQYYLNNGKTDKAREIAAEAGEVYSCVGLQAQATYFERTSNYDAALDYFSKIEERYDNSSELLDFCLRYKAQTGDGRFDKEVQKRLSKLFPMGIEKVSLSDFHSPPADGAFILQQNDRVLAAGLQASNVIVAVYGVRVHNLQQYTYARDLKETPQMDLIVWQGHDYHETKASPPRHLFGVDMADYKPH